MENQYLFILCGEAFSGKTTFSSLIAETYDAKIVGRDRVYFALDDILALENSPEEDDSDLWRNLWPLAVQGTKNQLLLGNSVVFDDNCLLAAQRNELRSVAESLGIKSVLIYLNISEETLKKRKEKNKITMERHDVPSGWIEEDVQMFERPAENEKPIIFTENDTADELIKMISNRLS